MGRPRTDIQPRIVHAARARFLAEGVDGASLRQIAADAGTSIGMVYYYFPEKDDLFLAVVEQPYERLLAEMTIALAPDLPVIERLRRLYTRLGALGPGELEVIRLVVREALVSPPRMTRLAQRFRRGHLPLMLATVADGVADGTFRADLHPALILLAIVTLGGPPQMMRRVAVRELPVAALPEGPALADQLVDVLLNGVGTRRRK